MYRNERKKLLELCDTMHELHEALINAKGAEELKELCSAGQQGAVRIGESLEAGNGADYAETVRKLEHYCEVLYEISESETVKDAAVTELEDTLETAKEVLRGIDPRLKIVFFPYKAEMWDSLESFYLAAKEDPMCDVFLVPIPYYEFDREKGEAVSRYDGARFPADEDPVPFNKFDHTDGNIDIAYIHYPYDDHNLVTSVHPAYYSRELKKYVSKLVYTPYFATSGGVSDDQLDLPVYRSADFVILQSEYSKHCCEGMYYYDRIKPFGSSKFDKVINKCKTGVDIPEEWKEVIQGRKTLMLNSSINDLLYWNSAVLDKLEYFFDLIKDNKRIAIIWRPHPLYESTFRSMRPELLERYEALKERFIKERTGVFDSNPDISDTVAIADGYIGSGASSVINLFAVVGKPVFIFNNMLREPVTREDRRVMELTGLGYVRGRLYLHPSCINALFSIDIKDLNAPLRYEGSVPDTVNWTTSLFGLEKAGDKLYMAPLYADDAVCFDPVMKNIETLGSVGREYDVMYGMILVPLPSARSVFFIPINNKYLIMEYLTGKKEWLYHEEAMMKLYEGVNRPSYMSIPLGTAVYDDRLYLSTGACNRILKLEQGNGEYEIISLGDPEYTDSLHIVLKGASAEGLWLCMGGSADIYMAPWGMLSDIREWRRYGMPEDFTYTHDDYRDMAGVHGQMIDRGDSMVILPLRHPHMIRLDKKTGNISHMAEGFFRDSDKKGIGYELKSSAICITGCQIGKDKYAVQRLRDMHIAIIDLNDGSYEEFVPEISEEIFDKLVPEDAGFSKAYVNDYFRMQESRLFPLENFIETFARGGYESVKERQLEALSSLAANLDGTCGVKTHEFLKQVIGEEDGRV